MGSSLVGGKYHITGSKRAASPRVCQIPSMMSLRGEGIGGIEGDVMTVDSEPILWSRQRRWKPAHSSPRKRSLLGASPTTLPHSSTMSDPERYGNRRLTFSAFVFTAFRFARILDGCLIVKQERKRRCWHLVGV